MEKDSNKNIQLEDLKVEEIKIDEISIVEDGTTPWGFNGAVCGGGCHGLYCTDS